MLTGFTGSKTDIKNTPNPQIITKKPQMTDQQQQGWQWHSGVARQGAGRETGGGNRSRGKTGEAVGVTRLRLPPAFTSLSWSRPQSDRPGVGSRTRRTWRLNSDAAAAAAAAGTSSVPGKFAGCSPIQAAAAPSNQSCSLDKTVLFLILLIFPKLLLPQMTWQVFPHDVIKRYLKGNVVESQHPIISVSGSFAAGAALMLLLFTWFTDLNRNEIINVLNIGLKTCIKYKCDIYAGYGSWDHKRPHDPFWTVFGCVWLSAVWVASTWSTRGGVRGSVGSRWLSSGVPVVAMATGV